MNDLDLDTLAARHAIGEALTLDEHRALTAARRMPDPYAKLGRGSTRFRSWQARLDDESLVPYRRK